MSKMSWRGTSSRTKARTSSCRFLRTSVSKASCMITLLAESSESLDVAVWCHWHEYEGHTFPQCRERNVHATGGLRVLDARLHGGTILQGGQRPPQEPNGPKVATASVPGLPLPLQSAELYLGRREPAGAAQSTALLHPARHRRLRRTVVLRRLPER